MKNFIRPVATSLCTIFLMASNLAFAIEAVGVLDRSKPTTSAKRKPSPLSVVASIDSGVGTYQDIQLPASTTPGFRADGRRVGIENTQHIGIPVRGSLQLEVGNYARNIFLDANFMQIATVDSPSEVSDSQYDRVEGNVGGKLGFSGTSLGAFAFIGEIGYRRSRFQNISAGHYISTILPQMGFAISPTSHWDLRIGGGVGVAPKFGYSDGEQSENLKSSVTGVSFFEGTIKYRLDRSAAIAVGAEFEKSEVTIGDTTEYSQLGLTVSSAAPKERVYQLSTTVGFLRLEKRW